MTHKHIIRILPKSGSSSYYAGALHEVDNFVRLTYTKNMATLFNTQDQAIAMAEELYKVMQDIKQYFIDKVETY